jgi:hypothetical protein
MFKYPTSYLLDSVGFTSLSESELTVVFVNDFLRGYEYMRYNSMTLPSLLNHNIIEACEAAELLWLR